MLAHVNPWLIYSWLGSLVIADIAAFVSAIGCFASRRRQRWLAVLAGLAIVLGSWVAHLAIYDGAGADWIAVLAVSPPVLGVISLIRWSLLSNDDTSA